MNHPGKWSAAFCMILALCLSLSACVAFATETVDVSVLIEQAQAAIEAEDYETAVPILLEAAEAGNATAQLWLGKLLQHRTGR